MAATIRDFTSNRWRAFSAAAVAVLMTTAGQAAQQERPDDSSRARPAQSTSKDAGEIVSQPVRDVGIEKTKIPPLLVEVSKDPYGSRGATTCRQISAAIVDLNGVLGADFSASPPAAKHRNVAKAGGRAIVNSLIPFRGLVREVSGAGPAERRLNAAIDAGFARRGFLRGLQRARSCRAAG